MTALRALIARSVPPGNLGQADQVHPKPRDSRAIAEFHADTFRRHRPLQRPEKQVLPESDDSGLQKRPAPPLTDRDPAYA